MITPEQMALSKAKISLIQASKFCFYANIAMRLEYVFTEDVPFAAIDGKKMFLNPIFWMKSINHNKRLTVILHEVEHIVRMHIGRRGNRKPGMYNRAGDYVINLALADAGCEHLEWVNHLTGKETKWLLDEKYRDMTTEQVYDLLEAEAQNAPPFPGIPGQNGHPDDEFDMGDIIEGATPEERKEIESQITDMIVSAATAARMSGQPGSIPGSVQVFVDGLLKPKLPLKNLLKGFFQPAIGRNNGYTWARPNRRMAGRFYLPAPKGKVMVHLAFAYDMSGSVTDADIKRYQSEVAAVLRELKPKKISVIQFDTRIISVTEITNLNDLMNMKLTGRGGTNIEPVMEWAAENKPHALHVFSDGEFYMPRLNPGMPVLWMIHSRYGSFNPPFGNVLPFEV